MKKHLVEFFEFIKNPKDEKSTETNSSYKWKVLFSLLCAELIFIAVYFPFLYLVNESFEFEEAYDLDLNMYWQFLLFVLLIPFFEELMFRLPLRRVGLSKMLFNINIWNKYYKWFFYSSVLAFGLIHITNYKITSIWIILLTPFIILSQIIGGAIMSYLRVRFNFWMGFLYHAIWNFIFVIGVGDELSKKETHITQSNYQLIINESSNFSSNGKTMLFSANLDSVFQLETKNYPLKDVIFVIDSTNVNYKPLIESIDLELKSEKGIPVDSLLTILEKEGYIEKT